MIQWEQLWGSECGSSDEGSDDQADLPDFVPPAPPMSASRFPFLHPIHHEQAERATARKRREDAARAADSSSTDESEEDQPPPPRRRSKPRAVPRAKPRRRVVYESESSSSEEDLFFYAERRRAEKQAALDKSLFYAAEKGRSGEVGRLLDEGAAVDSHQKWVS